MLDAQLTDSQPAKAEVEAIKKTVDDAASVSIGLWFSYVFVLFYIAVAAGAVTHADLLLKTPVRLPFLNIDLPLLAFFALAPIMFILTHAYVLVHFVMLSYKAQRLHEALYAYFPDQVRASINDDEDQRNAELREYYRRQLPSNIFVQFLAGPSEIRNSGFGLLLKLIAWATLAVAPVCLGLLLQVQFLPYHHLGITWLHRVVLALDLLLIWWLWTRILGHGTGKRGYLGRMSTLGSGLCLSFACIVFSICVVTFPGEWQERGLPTFSVISRSQGESNVIPQSEKRVRPGTTLFSGINEYNKYWPPVSLHEYLFVGDINESTRRRGSIFSNTIVVPGFVQTPTLDGKKEGRILDFRGRALEGAILSGAKLNNADFFGANLEGAFLDKASLNGATFDASNLAGASFLSAKAEGATFSYAQLQGSMFMDANLRQASFEQADLTGSTFHKAVLPSANFASAKLRGVDLAEANVQGANFTGSILNATNLDRTLVWGANLPLLASNLIGNPVWESKPYAQTANEDSTSLTTRRSKKQVIFCGMKDNEAVEQPATERCKLQQDQDAREVLMSAQVDAETYTSELFEVLRQLVCSGNQNAGAVVRSQASVIGYISLQRRGTDLIDLVLGPDCSVSKLLTNGDKRSLMVFKRKMQDSNAPPTPVAPEDLQASGSSESAQGSDEAQNLESPKASSPAKPRRVLRKQ